MSNFKLESITTGRIIPYSRKTYNKNKKALNAQGYYEKGKVPKDVEKEVVLIQKGKGKVIPYSKELFDREVEFKGRKVKQSEKLLALGYRVVEPSVDEVPEKDPDPVANESAGSQDPDGQDAGDKNDKQ